MKKNSIIILFLFFTLPVYVISQSNYKAGYIITKENDTITGLVDYRTDKVNAEFCRFKVNQESVPEIFYPGDISGYRFIDEGKFYVSRTVEIEGITKEVFLEFIIKGIMNLYYYSPDMFRKYYFFEDESGSMLAITRKTTPDLIEEEGKLYRLNDTSYKSILRNIFAESENVLKDIDKAGFHTEAMLKLTKKYHEDVCTTGEECIIFEGKQDKHYIRYVFSAYAGIEWQKFKLDIYSKYNAGYEPSPVAGVQANFSVPRWIKSLSLQADFYLSKIKSENNIKHSPASNNVYYINNYQFKALGLTGKLGLKYTHQKGIVRPTFETSFIFKHLSNISGERCTYYYNSNNELINSSKASHNHIYMPQNNFWGGELGIGADVLLNRRKENAVFMRLTYSYLTKSGGFVYDRKDKIEGLQLKAGYTF